MATADTSATVKVAPESSDDRQYPIPVRVVLDDIKLVVTPKQVRLHVGSEQSQASTAVTVDLSAPDETGRDVDSLLLEIRQSGTGPAFSPDELWVQAAGPPLTVDQRAEVFRAEARYTAAGLLPASAARECRRLTPLLPGRPGIRIPRLRSVPGLGSGATGNRGARSKRGQGHAGRPRRFDDRHLSGENALAARWRLDVLGRTRRPRAAEFVFARSTDANVDDGGRFTAALRSSNVLQLKAAEGRPEDTWTDLALTFEVPPAATEGSYFHEVALRDSRVEYKRLAVELNIRPLQIEFRPAVVDLRAELDNKFTATTPFAVTLVNPNEPTVGTGQLKLELKPGDEQAASFGVDEIWIQTVADPLPASDRSRSLVLEGLATPLFAFFHPKSTTRLELSDVPLRFELSCEGEGFGAVHGAIDAVLAPPVFQFTREMAAIHTCRSSESVELVNGLRVFWIASALLSFVPDQQVRFVPSQEPAFPEAAPFDAVVNGGEVSVESVDRARTTRQRPRSGCRCGCRAESRPGDMPGQLASATPAAAMRRCQWKCTSMNWSSRFPCWASSCRRRLAPSPLRNRRRASRCTNSSTTRPCTRWL